MTGISAVKIDSLCLFILKIVDRNRIRIPVIAIHRQYTAARGVQQPYGSFGGKLVFLGSHGSEHDLVSFVNEYLHYSTK